MDENGFCCQERHYQTVIGDVSEFPEAKDMEIGKAVRDCVCVPPLPELRVIHFEKLGIECWFLVNEANKPLEAEVLLPTEKLIGAYNLWTGKSEKLETEKEKEWPKLSIKNSCERKYVIVCVFERRI